MKKILFAFLLMTCQQSAWSQLIPIDIYGVYYSGGKEMFARGDLSTNVIFDIAQISGVSGVTSGYLDRTTNKYILGSNLGILVIDANTGQVLDTIINSALGGVVYDSATNDVYGVLWNGSQEKFARIDLDSEIVDTIATLPGVTGIASGSGYLDERNGYYIIKTDLGLVVINIHTGNVVKSFNPAVNIENVVYDAATNDIYGVFWNGSQEKFARIDLDSQQVDSFPVLVGVNGIHSSGCSFDSETGYYVVGSNLGVLVIDKNTGTLLATLSTTMKNLIFPTIRKRVCPLPVVPSFGFNSSGFTLSINANVSQGTIVYWSFGDGDWDTTTTSSISLTHTYLHADTFRICMTTKDSCGYSLSYCDSVAVPATGINQQSGMKISVYPIPFSSAITIRYPKPAINHKLNICDMLGKEIINTVLNGNPNRFGPVRYHIHWSLFFTYNGQQWKNNL
jgi:hypothetical protein